MEIKLSTLNQAIGLSTINDKIIYRLVDDSRKVKANDAYVCTLTSEKGIAYVEEALQKDAIVYGNYVYQHENYYQYHDSSDLQVLIETFYQFNWDNIIVIGICGTNGKTSTAKMLYHNVKTEAMLVSTHHIYCRDEHFSIRNTTPNAFELAYYVQYALNQKCKYIIMEVSSHAIDQKRIVFLRYDFIIYTNITSDHLDYHLCRTHYIFTKLKLRYYLKAQGQIICYPNLPYCMILKKDGCKVLSLPKKIVQSENGIWFEYAGKSYQIPYHTTFQMENATLVLYVLQQLGLDNLAKRMRELPIIEGRCEMMVLKGIRFLIDYAHSEDGLYQLLKNVYKKDDSRCICILGCGGNRDITKRSKMGEIACRYSDLAIYTSDNPRDESIHDIIKMMMNHTYFNYEVIENRYYAIKYAVKYAKKDDIIIIAGKGDERTQEMKGKFYPFFDKQCIKKIIEEEL